MGSDGGGDDLKVLEDLAFLFWVAFNHQNLHKTLRVFLGFVVSDCF